MPGVNATVLAIAEQLAATVGDVMDRQTRQLVAAWATAWDQLEAELQVVVSDLAAGAEGRLPRSTMLRSERLARALAQAAEALTELAEQTIGMVASDLPNLLAVAAQSQAAMVAAALPPGAAFDRFTRASLDAIVTRTTEQVTALSWPMAEQAADGMRRELIRGAAVGTNPRVAAYRMVARAGGHFNGGLGRAMTIARTEQHDALRAAALDQRTAAGQVVTGWTWLAQLGGRTCPACWSMHGTTHPASEPGPIGHQNCRCVAVPLTPSWRDLGFDLDDPPSVMPDAEAVFKGLSKSEQVAVLGPARYQAWVTGRFPMDAWAVRRHTPGWRDSYAPAPASGIAAARLAS